MRYAEQHVLVVREGRFDLPCSNFNDSGNSNNFMNAMNSMNSPLIVLQCQIFLGRGEHQLDPVELVYFAGAGIVIDRNDI